MIQVEMKSSDLARLSRQLREAGSEPAIKRKLTKGLRDGTKPAVTRARAAALGLPSNGNRHTGLRRRIAASTGTQVRSGGRNPTVSVVISRRKMGPQASVAIATNQSGGWRHPVFQRAGAAPAWTRQVSRAHWFDDVNRFSAPGVRRAIQGAVNDIEKQMEHR
jgi:hypothetical protein